MKPVVGDLTIQKPRQLLVNHAQLCEILGGATNLAQRLLAAGWLRPIRSGVEGRVRATRYYLFSEVEKAIQRLERESLPDILPMPEVSSRQ